MSDSLGPFGEQTSSGFHQHPHWFLTLLSTANLRFYPPLENTHYILPHKCLQRALPSQWTTADRAVTINFLSRQLYLLLFSPHLYPRDSLFGTPGRPLPAHPPQERLASLQRQIGKATPTVQNQIFHSGQNQNWAKRTQKSLSTRKLSLKSSDPDFLKEHLGREETPFFILTFLKQFSLA